MHLHQFSVKMLEVWAYCVRFQTYRKILEGYKDKPHKLWYLDQRTQETSDWHSVNTNFISKSRNWYWCRIITLLEDSLSQKKIATHRIHERWFKEICLGVFFYCPPWKINREGKYIKKRDKGRCRPRLDKMLNQTAHDGWAGAHSLNCCLVCFMPQNKTETELCTFHCSYNPVIKTSIWSGFIKWQNLIRTDMSCT